MGVAWACHYRKNQAGWPNPWDSCISEIQSYLVCSDVLTGKPLQVDYTGATSGVDYTSYPETYYAGSSGFYQVRVTTGYMSEVPCSGAHVYFQLFHQGWASTGRGNPVLNTSFYTNADGRYSGYFEIPYATGGGGLSGWLFAVSGQWTGARDINSNITMFPEPSITSETWSETANTVSFSVTNTSSLLSGYYILERSTDYGVTYTPVQQGVLSVNGGANDTSGYSQNLGWTYAMFRAYFLPQGFKRGVYSLTEPSGGHPPPPTDFGFEWFYTGTSINNAKPGIRYGRWNQDTGSPVYSGYLFDAGIAFNAQYTGGAVTTWTDIQFESHIILSGFNGLTFADYFLRSVSDLIGVDRNLWFKASGVRTSAEMWYSEPVQGGPYDMSGITAYANTSPNGCGIDVYWTSPPLAGGWTVNWSGFEQGDADKGSTTTGLPMYYHNSSANCGRWYFFTICSVDDPSICSDPVSGKGVFYLNRAQYEVSPKNIGDVLDHPTEAFDVAIRWDNKYYDERAEEISGVRDVVFSPANSAQVVLPYAHVKSGIDAGHIPLLPSTPNTVSYKMYLVSGRDVLDPPITGRYPAYETIQPGRQPPTPTLVSVTTGEQIDQTVDVTITWNNVAFGNEYYIVHRDGGAGDIETRVNGSDAYWLIETGVPRGYTYTYYVETQSHYPYYLFTGASDFSNSIDVTIPLP